MSGVHAFRRVNRCGGGLLAGLLLAAGTAHAQDDVTLFCETKAGVSLMNSDLIEWHDGLGTAACNVDYTNNDVVARNDVYAQLVWSTTTLNPLAPVLPDGVTGLVDPFSASYSMLSRIIQIPGSPAPSTDLAADTTEFYLDTVPALSSSEIFFDWIKETAQPEGISEVSVEIYEGGVPGVGTLVANKVYEVEFLGGNVTRVVEPIPEVNAEHRYVGSAFGDQKFPDAVHTNVQMRLYLPYWNGVEYLADGGFSSFNLSHQAVVDESRLSASLVLFDTKYAATQVQTMPEGTALDAFGNRSWPTSGLNANSLIVYDPAVNVLTGVPGLHGAGDRELSPTVDPVVEDYLGWKLRWDAAFNPTVTLNIGDVLPVQYCYESDQTGPVAPGDPTYCFLGETVVGKETLSLSQTHINCASAALPFDPCETETFPYVPGEVGTTKLRFQNNSSLTGTGEIVTQIPGKDADKIAVFSGARLGEQTPFSSTVLGISRSGAGLDSAEIWVSTQPADFSGPSLTSRQVPAAGAVWVQCPTTGGDTSPLECDAADLPVAAADVTEVRVVMKGMRPQHTSLNDAPQLVSQNAEWTLEVDWAIDTAANSSIDGSTYDPTSTDGEAFGIKSQFDFTPDDTSFGPLAESSTNASELSRESLVTHCGAYVYTTGLDPAAFTALNNFCGGSTSGYYGYVQTVLQPTTLLFGIENEGTLDNVTGPIEVCMAMPFNLRYENTATADPMMPRVFVSEEFGGIAAGTSYELTPAEYGYTFTASTDPDIEGELCVQIPTLTLLASNTVIVATDFLILPGADDPLIFANDEFGVVLTDWEAQGEDASGATVTLTDKIRRTQIDLSGAAATDVNISLDPSDVIGLQGGTCYVHEWDTHAFDDSGTPTLDPAGATLPTEDAVAYTWIPAAGLTPPAAVTGTTTATLQLWTTASDDAIATWVHTTNEPARGDATTLAANGWQLCSVGSDPCDATALSALGLTEADVRWTALEFGTLEISDAEPRGQAPFDGLPRINNTYQATVCVQDDGTSSDGEEAWLFTETQSSNLLTVNTEAPVLFLDGDCVDNQLSPNFPVTGPLPPNVGYATDEVCDGLDNDCDGVVPDDEIDNDGDGFSECEGDCDDTNDLVYPGAPEICDGLDNDCDGTIPADEIDADGDGYSICDGDCDDTDASLNLDDIDGDGFTACRDCDDTDPTLNNSDVDGDGQSTCQGDCDDFNPDTYGSIFICPDPTDPGCFGTASAPEICDGLDNNCDGLVPTTETDDDGDGISECEGDCDDTNPDTFPGATEICDGEDNDCDTIYPMDEIDIDGDGFSECEGDCNEKEITWYPGAPELCDGEDNDCNLVVSSDEIDDDGDGLSDCDGDCDDTDPTLNSDDLDGDGFSTCDGDCDDNDPTQVPVDTDGDGFTICNGDCDDTDPTLTPEDIDLDGYSTCDGDCDDTDPTLNLDDIDMDGFTTCDGDCDDNDPTLNLDDIDGDGATSCDGDCDDADPALGTDDIDMDGFTTCDGDCDDADPTLTPADIDLDGSSTCTGDCDDTDPNLNPDDADGDGTSTCDGDCDDTDASLNLDDDDADGVTTCDGDCDDADATSFPGAYELCDGTDQDCDGDPTNGFPVGEFCTVGVGACETVGELECTADGLSVECDAVAGTPGVETCDGIDSDCDGFVDATEDADGVWSWCDDTDNDGLTDATEHFEEGTDPFNEDSDGDGCQDGTELGLTEPENPDATDPAVFIPDADPDTTTDPLDADSDDDGLSDCEEDLDGDGEVDIDETDPNNADSDGGGVPDGEEIDRGSDPLLPEDDFPGTEDTAFGLEPEVERWVGGSCQGCQSTGGSGGATIWMLMALGLLGRRRRDSR